MPGGRTTGYAHDPKTRERIKTALLTDRLQANALGEYDAVPEIAEWLESHRNDIPEDAVKALEKAIKRRNRTPMTQTQVNSAIALINRTLPVLQATEATIRHEGSQSVCDMTDEELAVAIAQGDNVKAIG